MIQGFIIQAVAAQKGLDNTFISLRQILLFPAAEERWTRSIDSNHPKRQWRKSPSWTYDLNSPFGSSYDRHFEVPATEREDARWHLTGDPVGFQITDDEYEAMKGGTMPRNVPLRAQRALESTRQVLIGKGANRTASECIGRSLELLARHPMATVRDSIHAELTRLHDAVKTDSTAVLLLETPGLARARGAGAHRPNVTETPLAASAPVSEPLSAAVAPPVAPVVRTARAGAVKPGESIIAGDGVPYIARAVEADERNLSDVELFRRAYAHNMNVLLLGEPGTGKTRGLLAAFPDAIVVPVTGDTEVSDLIGSYVPSGPDSFIWVDGPLTRAMDEGRMLVMDEGGLADSKVLAVLYPLMDKKGEARKLLVTANPARGTITAKDGFGIAFTTNPNAKGVHIAEPLLSRCAITMTVTSDYKVARDLGCNERLVQAAEHMAKQREAGEMGWAPEMRNLLDARDLEAKFGIIMALRALIMQAPEMEREVVEIQLRERFGDIAGAARKVKALGI
jgi:nitric oxide reductase NorQ protein